MPLLHKGRLARLGAINYALSFDGIDDYVEVAHSTSLVIADELSIIAWIYGSEDFQSSSIIVGKSLPDLRWVMGIPEGYTNRVFFLVYLTDSNSYSVLSPTGLSLGSYHYVGATFKRNDAIKLYIGADEVDSLNVPDFPIEAETNALLIGGAIPAGLFYKGAIHGVLVYNRALNAQEMLQNKNAKTPLLNGLVLRLPMNEGSGNIAHDKSGQGNNGTIYGATWVRR